MKNSRPLTYDIIARNASESVAPELWPDHALIPALGVTGRSIPNIASGINGPLGSAASVYIDQHGVQFTTNSVSNSCVIITDIISALSATRGGTTFLCKFYNDNATAHQNRVMSCAGRAALVVETNGITETTLYDTAQKKNNFSGVDFNNVWRTVVMAEGGGTFESYNNGVLKGSQAFTSPCIFAGATWLGAISSVNSVNLVGCISHFMVYGRKLPVASIHDISADPLLPFRRKDIRDKSKVSFYFKKPANPYVSKYRPKTDTLSYDTIARSKEESVAPELWPDHAWVPALGCTGLTLPDVGGGGFDGSLVGGTWGPGKLTLNGTSEAVAINGSLDVAQKHTFFVSGMALSGLAQFDTLMGFCNTGGRGLRLWTRDTSNHKLYFEGYDDAPRNVTSLSPITSYGQTTVGAVYDGAALVLYVGNDAPQSVACGALTGVSSPSFIIGAMPAFPGPYQRYWPGDYGVVQHYVRALPQSEIQRLSADPLLPFRKKTSKTFFFKAPTKNPTFAKRRSVGKENLTYDTIARGPDESVAPELWPFSAIVPSLGATGRSIPRSDGGNIAISGSLTHIDNTGLRFIANNTLVNVTVTNMFSKLSSARTGTSLFIRFRSDPQVTDHRFLYSLNNSGGGRMHQEPIGGGAYRMRVSLPNTAGSQCTEQLYTPQNPFEYMTLSACHNNATMFVYYDGILRNSASCSGPGIYTNAGMIAQLRESYTSYNFLGTVTQFYVYDKCLSPEQNKELAADPLLPFRRKSSKRTYFFSYQPTQVRTPNPPIIAVSETPTLDTQPEWSWVSGGGVASGVFRWSLDQTTWYTTTINAYSPPIALAPGTYTLYVQEKNNIGGWSEYGYGQIIVQDPGGGPSYAPKWVFLAFVNLNSGGTY